MTTLDPSTLDKLLEGVNPSDPQSLLSDAGLFGQLKKALAECMLQAELNHHLEQERGVTTLSCATSKSSRHLACITKRVLYFNMTTVLSSMMPQAKLRTAVALTPGAHRNYVFTVKNC